MLFDRLVQLEHEPALADPGHAHERDELRRVLLERTGEGILEQVDLPAPAHERRAVYAIDRDSCPGADRLPGGNRLRLALRLD